MGMKPDNEKFLKAQVDAGVFASMDDALDCAVESLRANAEAKVIADRWAQYERDGTAFDHQTVANWFDTLEAANPAPCPAGK